MDDMTMAWRLSLNSVLRPCILVYRGWWRCIYPRCIQLQSDDTLIQHSQLDTREEVAILAMVVIDLPSLLEFLNEVHTHVHMYPWILWIYKMN